MKKEFNSLENDFVRLRIVQEKAKKYMRGHNDPLKELYDRATLILEDCVMPWMNGDEIATAERRVAAAVDEVSLTHGLESLYQIVHELSLAYGVLWDDASDSDAYHILFGYNPTAK